MMILHTIGDSHSYAGWQDLVLNNLIIKIHHLGAITCSSFGFNHLDIIKNYDIYEGEIVCFIFGEIDCRTHMNKHKQYFKEIIDKIVENYFNAIRVNVKDFQNLTTMVVSVVPPARKESYSDELGIQYGTPTVGEDEDRKIFVKYMNKKIKENCKKYNYIYFNIHDKYCDNEGFLNQSLSDKNVHIKDHIYIKEELINLFNLEHKSKYYEDFQLNEFITKWI